MAFTSIGFYLFFLLVLFLAAASKHRLRIWILVIASYLFYGTAEPWYCLLLFASTLVDFIAGGKIHGTLNATTRKFWLSVSVFLNLTLLGVFKYADFALQNLGFLLGDLELARSPWFDLVLPVGISFYTFQTMSYTIDIYRGRQEPTRDFAAFALYVSFFPQLVAGPIERARSLLSQFEKPFAPSREDLEYGVQRILWGLAKKTIFADRFALVVNAVYSRPESFSSPELMLATFCFSFQLYLDFSAYTDIAIGLARCFGIRLNENFNYPFLARNPSDFWARWHITLTSWFRDYLYSALGGTRRHAPLTSVFAILLTMSIMGLWHGAEWHFVIFGLLSGVMVAAYMVLRLVFRRKRMLGTSFAGVILSIVLMNIIINLIMVFFRAPTLHHAASIFYGIINAPWTLNPAFYLPLGMLLFAMTWHVLAGNAPRRIHNLDFNPLMRGAVIALLFLAINYLAVDRQSQFIYFRF